MKDLDGRLAEILSSAGLNEGRVALEVLYLMPPKFVSAYEALFHRALALGTDGLTGERADRGRVDEQGRPLTNDRVQAARQGRLTEGKTLGGMGTAKTTGKRYRRAWIVADERALGRKTRIDKALRRLAREIETGMAELAGGSGWDDGGETDERGGHRCTGRKCRKFLEDGWNYCPFCGTRQRNGGGDGNGGELDRHGKKDVEGSPQEPEGAAK